MDDLTLVRRRIGDMAKTESEQFVLIDTGSSVQLKYESPTIVDVFDRKRDEEALILGTDYTVSANTIVLLYTPDNEAILTVVYTHAAFTDAELQSLIDEKGVAGAVHEALKWLRADAAKLYSYSRGQTKENPEAVFKQLDRLVEQAEKEDSSTGDVQILSRTNPYYKQPPSVEHDFSRLQ